MKTRVGIYPAVIKDRKILLRKDPSGNWELVRGEIKNEDFDEVLYYAAVFRTIQRELPEVGLALDSLSVPIPMLPAWLCKDDIIDLAFVVLVPWQRVVETSKHRKMASKGQLEFFSKSEAEKLNIASPRMKKMIEYAFSA